jgi:hypothetical protein
VTDSKRSPIIPVYRSSIIRFVLYPQPVTRYPLPSIYPLPFREARGPAVSSELTRVERWVLGAVGAIAVLTFFFPLLTFHVPIVGDQPVSGYDVVSKVRQFSQAVRSASPPYQSPREMRSPSNHSSTSPARDGSGVVSAPLSLRLSWLIPVLITGALIGAGLTVVGSVVGITLARRGSTFGAVCGIGAILHIAILNSDVHTFMQQAMAVHAAVVQGNPFAGFAQALGNLAVNALTLAPGAGLWVLTGCLVIAAAATHTRALSTIRVAAPPSIRTDGVGRPPDITPPG